MITENPGFHKISTAGWKWSRTSELSFCVASNLFISLLFDFKIGRENLYLKMLAFSVEKNLTWSVVKVTETVQLKLRWEKFKQNGQDQDYLVDEPP